MHNYQIPAQQTTYACIGYILPNDTQYQVIGVEPILDTQADSSLVHHMLLWACSVPLTGKPDCYN